MMKRNKIGITYGTFDHFHIGHYNLFKKAKELCDTLVVAVSTTKFNTIKGKVSDENEWSRKRAVSLCPYVDYVIDESLWEQKNKDIKSLNIDVVFMGSDWKDKEEFKNLNCEVVFFPRTKGISSTIIRNGIKKNENKRKGIKKNKNDKTKLCTRKGRVSVKKRSKDSKKTR